MSSTGAADAAIARVKMVMMLENCILVVFGLVEIENL